MKTFRPTSLTLCAACWLCACTGGSPHTTSGRGESEETARTPTGPACASDADCNACSTERGCGCFVTAEACPPTVDSCFVSPCEWRAASCAEGRCVMLPASGPCNSDDECETRPDPFRCAHVPARKGAPKLKAEFGCGERPDPPAVRCDEAKQECVLGPHASTGTSAVDLTLACAFHGTGVTTTTTTVTGTPPTVTVDASGKARVTGTASVAKLATVLASPGFAAFMMAAPAKKVPPHPGMTKCELEVRAPTLSTTSKRWTRGDEFAGDAKAALATFEKAIAAIRPPPAPRP